MAREAKKEKEANELLSDPWFSSLPHLVQLKLAGFVRKELDKELASAEWFDLYVYQAVVNKKYLSEEILKCLEKEPHELDPWDPMGTLAD